MDNETQFLVQKEPRLSQKEAEVLVDDLLVRLGINLNSSIKKGVDNITKNPGTDREVNTKYVELIQQVRKTGICDFIQKDLDRSDNVFGGALSISTNASCFELTVEWAGYKKELKGPFRNTPSEIELSEDIEFYKEETCIESSNHNFEMVSRNYRGYLFSSIALIDCYINRHILYYDKKEKNTNDFNKLKNSRKTEERLELFVKNFCDFSYSSLKQSAIWDDFKKLQYLRNEMVHSVNPYMGIEIKEIASNLNLSICGVGSLLNKLQLGQSKFSLSFIERVRTSPLIYFNQITKTDGGKTHKSTHLNKISR